jgi:hypothetical protein
LNKYSKIAKQTAKEVKWWSYAAWTLPFVALAAIVFEFYIGHDDWIAKTIWATTVVFFSISVYWWWAIHKFRDVYQAMVDNQERFNEVKEELKKVRLTFEQDDNVDLR